MPLYEGWHNAENVIKVSPKARDSIIFSTDKTISALAEIINNADGAVAAGIR